MKKLDRQFYLNNTLEVAKNLLGKNLVHIIDGVKRVGMIVETEAYIGSIDKACHAYNYKKTPRTEVLFMNGGVSYVYLIYGMYYCMNVITEKEEEPCAVLIRAVEPIEGLNEMSMSRYNLPYNSLNKRQITGLTNGPGKLCIAMGITKNENKLNLLSDKFYISENTEVKNEDIVQCKRINIDYAEEAADFPWRFYIKDNKYVSKK